jgi:putative endonuclease
MGVRLKRKTEDSWNLYIAECADGSYYTGITKDVGARIETHNAGKGSKYTATHRPVKLVFQEPQADYSAALRREYQIKNLPKSRKTRFVAGETLPRPGKKAKMTFQTPRKKKKTKASAKTRRRKGRYFGLKKKNQKMDNIIKVTDGK